MEYLTGKFHQFTQYLYKNQQQEERIEISRTEAYLNFIYKLFVWEDPTVNWTVLMILHFLFWLIVQLELRIYGVLFFILLIAFICDTYFEKRGLKAQRNDSSDTMRQIFFDVVDFIKSLKALRKDNPSAFCGTMCMVFLVISFIAKSISGYMLAYLTLLTIFFGPVAFSKLPPEYAAGIKKTLKTISTNEGIVAENELIPFISEKDLNERDVDLDSLINDDKNSAADSVTNSLVSGISSIPSHMEVDGSLDGLEEEDLELPVKTSTYFSNPTEYSSDSDSEHKNIRFESSHFNRDSSSSSEENYYTKGLRFTEVTRDIVDSKDNPNTQSISGMLLTNLTAMGGSLMSNVLRTGVVPVNLPKRNDSDSDFEIISNDEIDEKDT